MPEPININSRRRRPPAESTIHRPGDVIMEAFGRSITLEEFLHAVDAIEDDLMRTWFSGRIMKHCEQTSKSLREAFGSLEFDEQTGELSISPLLTTRQVREINAIACAMATEQGHPIQIKKARKAAAGAVLLVADWELAKGAAESQSVGMLMHDMVPFASRMSYHSSQVMAAAVMLIVGAMVTAATLTSLYNSRNEGAHMQLDFSDELTEKYSAAVTALALTLRTKPPERMPQR